VTVVLFRAIGSKLDALLAGMLRSVGGKVIAHRQYIVKHDKNLDSIFNPIIQI
jgi:hypothetical protein